MSAHDVFSKVAVGPSRVSECSLWTNPDGPSNHMGTDTNIELSNPAIQTDPVTGSQLADMYLTVSVSYFDEDPARVPRMRLNVRINATVSSPTLTERSARVAAVSHLYPQASAYLATLGAMAQVNGVSLMAIDAESLVDVLESAAQPTQQV